MSKPRKQTEPQQQVTAHPEVKAPPQRVPDDRSSKTPAKERDARTGHDKDGNEQHPRDGRKAS